MKNIYIQTLISLFFMNTLLNKDIYVNLPLDLKSVTQDTIT